MMEIPDMMDSEFLNRATHMTPITPPPSPQQGSDDGDVRHDGQRIPKRFSQPPGQRAIVRGLWGVGGG